MTHEPLDEVQDILAVHEAHLDIDLGKLGLAIAACVLVAIAARDLEVFVEPRDHEELLIELRGLGERIELAGIEPGRHEVVAGAFRGRCDEGRGLELVEALGDEVLPCREGDLRAKGEVMLHLARAEVKVAVFEAEILVRVGLFVDDEGKGLRFVQDDDGFGDDLDGSGRHILVDH